MHIKEIFAKPIDRVIHKVVDVGNDNAIIIQTEIEEYIITNEVNQHLSKLLEVYLSRQRVNSVGVWIAGYFGSGKSHLLKMLSFLLTNMTFTSSSNQARSTVDIFAEKITHDTLLQGQIRRIADIPSESILFNIDQQAPQGSGQSDDVVLAVFLKMFNNHCGYYGNTPFIANFERDLDERNKFAAFKEHFAAHSGIAWEEGREVYALYQDAIDHAFGLATGTSAANAQGTIQRYENTYSMSIDLFGNLVKRYIEQRGDAFRLNFFVDEVGQFVANRTALMLNLQSISEVLSEKVPGRAWVFITSQQDLNNLVNSFRGQDLSKIQARYGNQISLTSASVDEVIQKRLLIKREHAVPALQAIHQRESNNYATLFTFSDHSEIYNRTYADEARFVDYYPFVPYQFVLFQQAIVSLSEQEAFVGSFQAVGERSLIAAAQEAAVQKMHHDIGKLIAFDDMYASIDASLRSIFKNSITLAQQTAMPPMATRVLKALFLVKYVRNFTATFANLRVLLFDTFQTDMRAFDTSLNDALLYLEQKTYIQREGQSFSYLTDEEKEIEKAIRGIQVDTSVFAEEIDKLVFTRILNVGNGKIRVSAFDQDYTFTRMIDHTTRGNQHELAVRIVTPYHDTTDDTALATQTFGKAELVIKLADRGQFMDELRLYIQTQRYIAQMNTQSTGDAARTVLQARARQNQRRYDQLNQDIKLALQEATYICNTSILNVGGGDHTARFNQAFTQMINLIYPNRGIVQANYTIQKVHSIVMDSSQFDTGTDAIATEVLSHINMMRGQYHKIDLKSIIERYQRRPFGWPLYAVLAAVAMLYRADHIEIRQNGSIINKRDLASVLDNAQMAHTILIEAQSIPAALIQPLVDFYQDYSAQRLTNTAPGQVVDTVKQAFAHDIHEIEKLLTAVASYPFVTHLRPLADTLRQTAAQSTNWFFHDFHTAAREELIYHKHHLLNPVLQFFNSAQKQNYDQARTRITDADGNVGSAALQEQHQLKDLLDHPEAFRGPQMTKINQLVHTINDRVAQHVDQLRTHVQQEITELYRSVILQEPALQQLTPDQIQTIEQEFARYVASMQSERRILLLQQMTTQFRTEQVTRLLNMIHHLARPMIIDKPTGGNGGGTVTPPVPVVPPVQVYVHANDIKLSSMSMSKIENAEQLEQYLQAVREAYQAVLDQGQKITL